MKKTTILAIYTDDTIPRRFVSGVSKRDDQRLQLDLTDDVNQAMAVEDANLAKEIIDNAHNPWERDFKTGKFEVVKQRPMFFPSQSAEFI